jgi:type I restriction enzyme, S subunit
MNNETMILLEMHFDTAFAAPDGIKKLRELILTLAMQGKLVPQDPNDEPASELLKSIEVEKQRLMRSGTIKQAKSLPKIDLKEVPYDLPKSWEWVRLGSISEYIQRGKSPSYSDIRVIPIISQKCIQWSGFDRKVVKFIDPSTLDKYQDERFIRKGDLLWNSTGTGTLGRINIYKDELKDFEKVVADSHVTIVRPIEICNEYVLNFLMSPIVQNHIEENASGTTNQIELNTTTVTIQIISLPPLPEQHRIVAEIDRLMARCDELEKLRADRSQKLLTVHTAALDALLKAKDSSDFSTTWSFITQHFSELYAVKENVAELRKTILQLAVMGKLVPQDPNDEPASELLKAIELEKSKLFQAGKIKQPKPLMDIKIEDLPTQLPNGWIWGKIDRIVSSLRNDIRTGPFGSSLHKADHKTQGIPVWGIESINKDGSFNGRNKIFVDSEKANELSSFSVKGGDIIISRSGTVGELCQLPTGTPYGLLSTNLMKISLNKQIMLPDYFCLLFKGAQSISVQLTELCVGSTRLFLTQSILTKLFFPIPPLAEQHRIISEVNYFMALCDRLEESIKAAKGKQTDLLNALMSQV